MYYKHNYMHIFIIYKHVNITKIINRNYVKIKKKKKLFH